MAPAKPLTEYLVFLGRSQIEKLAALAIDAYANNDGNSTRSWSNKHSPTITHTMWPCLAA